LYLNNAHNMDVQTIQINGWHLCLFHMNLWKQILHDYYFSNCGPWTLWCKANWSSRIFTFFKIVATMSTITFICAHKTQFYNTFVLYFSFPTLLFYMRIGNFIPPLFKDFTTSQSSNTYTLLFYSFAFYI